MTEHPRASDSQKLTSVRRLRSAFGLSGRMTMSRGWLRRHLWIAPVAAMLALALAGTWLRSHVEQAIQHQIEEELRALLNADVTALRLWLHSQESNALAAANDDDVNRAANSLVEFADQQPRTSRELADAPQRDELDEALGPLLEAHDYAGFVVINHDGTILAADNESLLGLPSLMQSAGVADKLIAGKATVSRPFTSLIMLPDENGKLAAAVPTMFAAAPIRNAEGEITAFLGLRIRPGAQFTEILNVGRFGETGETYAFDQTGRMLSASRFEGELKQIGLLVDSPEARSELTLELRDPGVDMTTGARAAARRSDQPLTRMAADAVAGHDGIDGSGYRDYRGVLVVGAWTWLPEYGFGVATEVDQSEVYRPVAMVRIVFWALFGLLAAAALTLLAMTMLAGRLERRMREAVLAAGKLGQYSLEEKIGEGGMGAVYRARHALLRRPTAIKLIEPSKTSEVAVARFEREVQHTSQLNHPNTITIYDYGRTDEGVFYYAMEFLDGYSLQSVVEKFGPLPDGRVIPILLQVCGSLLEAHSLGLIHRDIKPANIMLTRRAGVSDFVKLLDFGLVKATDNRMQTQLTAANSITGTPLYLPPECIQDPDSADARSDLYSLGGVGYYLLTGRPPFLATSVLEIIRRQVEDTPEAPSAASGRSISPELERVLLACLEKSPDKRPQSAAELAELLSHCEPLQGWNSADARSWWREHLASAEPAASEAVTEEIRLSTTISTATAPRKV